MEAVLALDNVAYRYPGSPAPTFEGLNLTVGRHEFVVLVGGSGAGKSTILRIAAGLIAPESGTVRLDKEREAGRRRRAMVFQDSRLMPWRSVRENVRLGLEGLELDASGREQRIADALRTTGLSELADRWPHQISGGQAQRVGIARALAVMPDILLMDEPFSAVDAITRRRLQNELLAIWQSNLCAVLFVTHDIDEAALLADRVLVLGDRPARLVEEITMPVPRSERSGSRVLGEVKDRIARAIGGSA